MIKTHDSSFIINLEHSISSDFKIFANEIELVKNSIIGLVGKNGSGKTSFLRSLSLREFLLKRGKNNFSFVEKIPKELTHLSCENYLNFTASFKESRLVSADLLEAMGYTEFRNKKISSLSTGQLRRFVNLLSLCKTNRIILLDEPFNGLDCEYENKLINYLRDTKITTLIAAHQSRILKNICDSFLLIECGVVKKIQDSDYGKVSNDKNYTLKFNAEIKSDHRLKYLGKKDSFYEYSFCTNSYSSPEKEEISEVLDVVKSHAEFFEEMKKYEGEFIYRSVN